MNEKDTKVERFGPCTYHNPAGYDYWTDDDSVVLFQTIFSGPKDAIDTVKNNPVFFEQAGPREKIYFKPEEVTAGIVTCGGLCPGINDCYSSSRDGVTLSLQGPTNSRIPFRI